MEDGFKIRRANVLFTFECPMSSMGQSGVQSFNNKIPKQPYFIKNLIKTHLFWCVRLGGGELEIYSNKGVFPIRISLIKS